MQLKVGECYSDECGVFMILTINDTGYPTINILNITFEGDTNWVVNKLPMTLELPVEHMDEKYCKPFDIKELMCLKI
jgi:hypothetical protein